MNTLSYGLLSLLSHSPLSGYDLMLRIQPFWPAKHSQIYPLLANLEKEEQVTFELVAQSDKPDKKVYSITNKGIDSLREWLSVPASDPVMRD
jgi:DNA-binding PadR family transcriptional regulator